MTDDRLPKLAVDAAPIASRSDGYSHLAASVILTAWRDRRLSGEDGDTARTFLMDEDGDLSWWAAVAGINPAPIRHAAQ